MTTTMPPGVFPATPATMRHGAASSVATVALWVVVFLGGFVLNEPAPYELAMLIVISGWLLSGPRFATALAPLLLIVTLFITGGLIATLMSDDFSEAILYIAVTGFLALTTVFYACVIAADPARLDTVRKAYTASAIVVALIGIGGYFGLLPGEVFTLYGRAKGTFQDPNVFGPFLALPWAFLLHGVLTRPFREMLWPALALAVLSFAILLSFSRAAWGLAAFSGIGIYALVFITATDGRQRARLLAIGAAAALAVVAMIVIALSVESISGMLLQRAKLVQDYDTARLGRFARYALGFQMVVDHPLGLGPLQFRNFFPEDEHNTFLKAFTTYGWLGGVAYLALVFFTAKQLSGLIFQPRAWQGAAQCVFVVLLGHMLLSFIIDTDRWRHLYLLYGLAWGLIAAEYSLRARRRDASRKPAAPAP
ncbi:O-antigen ligase family protein [Stappia sp.]|uniref:O-antigen ligase family protein n=1 Tax=Stappia sp. TaxID=1870903 RepID=UPI003C7D9F43